jgi:hypothetical protein
MDYIFLTYINRSGSTFLANELSKFNEILVCPEADILANLLLVKPQEDIRKSGNFILKSLKSDSQLRSWGLTEVDFYWPEDVITRFDAFKQVLSTFARKQQRHPKYIVYKAERLFQLVPGISLLQEDNGANFFFISLIRDIRAIFYSQYTTYLPASNKTFSNNPVATSLYWNNYIATIKKYRTPLHLSIHYEDLILEFNSSMKKICGFLSLNATIQKNRTGELVHYMPETHKKIHKNIGQAPLKERVTYWKSHLDMKDSFLIEKASGKYLGLLGYNKTSTQKLSYFYTILFVWLKFTYRLRILCVKIIFKIKNILE